MWRRQVPVVAERRRVVNPDFRGHGRSGPAEKPFDLYDLVDDQIAVLDRLGIDRATWAGLSIGGMVALRAALERPERVSGLVLIDTDAGAEATWKKLRYRAMVLGVRSFGLDPFLPAISRLMFGSTTRRRNPDLVEEWKGRFAAAHVPSMLRFTDVLQRRDSVVERLDEIAVPTLVLVGDEDETLPQERSEAIAEGIPGARLVVVPGSGHLAALERPEVVTDALLAFLDAEARA